MNKRRVFFFAVLFIISFSSLSADIFTIQTNSSNTSGNDNDKENEDVKALISPVNDLRLLAASTIDYPSTPGDMYQLTYMINNQILTTQIALDALYSLRVHNLGTLNAKGKTFLQLKTEVENLVSKNYPLSGVQFSLINPGSFFITLQGSHPNPGQKTATGLTRLSDILSDLNTKNFPWASLRDVKVISADNNTKTYDYYQAVKSGDMLNNPRLRPGDTVVISRAERYVKVFGLLHEPGTYQLLDTEGAAELIQNFASGFQPSADTEHIQLFRVTASDNEPGLFKTLTYDELINEKLEPGDQINVPNKEDRKLVFTIEGAVTGGDAVSVQVSSRTVYSFYNGQKLSDALKTLKSSISRAADYENSYFIRGGTGTTIDIAKFLYSTDLSQDRELEDGDILVIPFKYNYVWVLGAVNSPGRYPVQAGKTSEYYINLAGGYHKNSIIGKEKIFNAEGEKMPADYILEPEAKIEVPETWFMSFINTYWGHINLLWGIVSGTVLIVTTIMDWIPKPATQ